MQVKACDIVCLCGVHFSLYVQACMRSYERCMHPFMICGSLITNISCRSIINACLCPLTLFHGNNSSYHMCATRESRNYLCHFDFFAHFLSFSSFTIRIQTAYL